MNPEKLKLPNTDSPEVMQQAVAVYMMDLLWEEVLRTVDPDKVDEKALECYERVYNELRRIHAGS